MAGTECPEGMDRAPDLVRDRCRKGHYCLRGDINPYPVPCPNGTFNEFYGLQSVCILCFNIIIILNVLTELFFYKHSH